MYVDAALARGWSILVGRTLEIGTFTVGGRRVQRRAQLSFPFGGLTKNNHTHSYPVGVLL
jgi:hypothetical protein